jgi:hypothetical protein
MSTAPPMVLRPKSVPCGPQHLHGLDVPEIHAATDAVAHVHVVDVEAHAGIDVRRRIGLANSADGDDNGRAVARKPRARVEHHVGRALVELVRAEDLLALQRFGSECRDGYRRLLQIFLHTARGDGDLFETKGSLFVLRVLCGRRPVAEAGDQSHGSRGHRVCSRVRAHVNPPQACGLAAIIRMSPTYE